MAVRIWVQQRELLVIAYFKETGGSPAKWGDHRTKWGRSSEVLFWGEDLCYLGTLNGSQLLTSFEGVTSRAPGGPSGTERERRQWSEG